ncbi:hypothetical protein Tco_1552241 [Tanacetum coccineum]
MENSQSQQASISGRIISERRSRLTPESVEVCICLKDYLDGVHRVQHETSLEGPILEDVEETIAREEVELGISPPNTELDEGEFEDLDCNTPQIGSQRNKGPGRVTS